MLTIATALPFEAGRFARRLEGRVRTSVGEGWCVTGRRDGRPVRVCVSGPGETRARALLDALASIDPETTTLVAAGVAGGLSPEVSVGDLVLAGSVCDARGSVETDGALRAQVAEALAQTDVSWREGACLGVSRALASPAEKRERGVASGALVVQMEDHVWARVARERGIAFVSVRAVLDSVSDALPPALARWNWRGPSAREVLGDLVRDPGLAVTLVRLARRRATAAAALDRFLEALAAQVPAAPSPP